MILGNVPLSRGYRGHIRTALASILHYSRFSRLTQHCANRLQRKTTKDGVAAFPFVKRRESTSVQILGYHRINDDADAFLPAMPTKIFAAQMEFLSTRYNVLSLEQAVDRLERDDLPDDALVITFDDGYRDNYLNAFPILRDLSLPATIFLATAAIECRKVLWHDRVFAAFRQTRRSVLQGFAGAWTGSAWRTPQEKLVAQNHVLLFLRSLDDQTRSSWISTLMTELEVAPDTEAPDLMLTWRDIEVMHHAGISFGSHTVSHPPLAPLPPARARIEISESKATIEQRLGTRVTAFAYPFGKHADFDDKVKRIVKDAGYRCALTAIPGINDRTRDLFELRRGTPWETDVPGFALRLQWSKFCS